MDSSNRFSNPPYMGQASLGLSGHNQFKAAGLPTVIPSRVDNPYNDPYAGIRSHSIKKIILNSVNANTDLPTRERVHIPKGAENSDFTINISDQLQSIAQNNVASISLGDITFPGGQYLIEDEWSHVDFSEGIWIHPDFREITLLFRDMFSNGDDLLLVSKLPLSINKVVDFVWHDSTTFTVVLEHEHSSSIVAVQNLWNDGLRLDAFLPSSLGSLVLGKDSANITASPNMHVFHVKLLNGQTVNSVGPSDHYGYLTTSALQSPLHFAYAVSAMLECPEAFQSAGYTKLASGSTNPAYVIPRYNINFGWNAEIDTFSYYYSGTEEFKTPELSGPLFSFMGYREGTCPSPLDETFAVTVTAPSKRQTYALSGTFMTHGQYESHSLFQSALSNALNGNWFGPLNSAVDATTAKFSLHFKYLDTTMITIEVNSGRYTPVQLAQAIEVQMRLHGMPVQVRAVIDCEEFKGLSFAHDEPALPFSLAFDVAQTGEGSPVQIYTPFIGYMMQVYSGCSHYEPHMKPRWHPVFYQGDNCDSETTLPTQTYNVYYDESLKKITIKAKAFNTLEGTVVSNSGSDRILVLGTAIAHGAQPGMRVVLKQGSTIVEGIVMSTADPLELAVHYGGTPVWDDSAAVFINFVSSSWNLNTLFSVKNCVIRTVIGASAAFYVMDKGLDSFGIKSHDKLVMYTSIAYVSPNCMQLWPFEYVFIVVTFNHKDGEGSTIGIQTKKFGEEINGSVVHALARISIGRFSPESHSDAFERHYELQSIGVSKISSIRIQILNPDFTYYRSHGKHISVGLILNVVGERVFTTQ